MTPTLSTDKMRYYQLLALACEDLHTSAIDALVRSEHKATTAQLTAIRQGRKINLPWLIDLVRGGLPKYQILADAAHPEVAALKLPPNYDKTAQQAAKGKKGRAGWRDLIQ